MSALGTSVHARSAGRCPVPPREITRQSLTHTPNHHQPLLHGHEVGVGQFDDAAALLSHLFQEVTSCRGRSGRRRPCRNSPSAGRRRAGGRLPAGRPTLQIGHRPLKAVGLRLTHKTPPAAAEPGVEVLQDGHGSKNNQAAAARIRNKVSIPSCDTRSRSTVASRLAP